MAKEHSLVLIKPDGVELSLTGEVLTHLDREDIFIVGMKAVQVTEKLAGLHYYEHRDKPFYLDVMKYLMGGYHSFPWIYAFVCYGDSVCEKIRGIVGNTNPLQVDHGKKIVTLRQKYGRNVIVSDEKGKELHEPDGRVVVRFENVVHASFSDSSEYEVKLWFRPEEIIETYRIYPTVTDRQTGELNWKNPSDAVRRRMFPG